MSWATLAKNSSPEICRRHGVDVNVTRGSGEAGDTARYDQRFRFKELAKEGKHI